MTIDELRAAAHRCLKSPVLRTDLVIAHSLLDAIDAGSTVEQLVSADHWFNKGQVLPQFMQRYGEITPHEERA